MKNVVGTRLRELRGDKSQSAMAEMLGISAGFYGALERGLKSPSYETIQKLIEHTGKDANYWFGIESSSEATDKHVAQDDISTLISLLQNISSNSKNLSRYIAATINKDTTIAQLIAVIAQIRAYISELDPTMLADADRRVISDLLYSCQRTLDDHGFSETKDDGGIGKYA